jgi:hypothetical protein
MRLSPCRFELPLRDNLEQPVEPRAILDLRRELNEKFQGFSVHPTGEGQWQSQAGRSYQEEVVDYEVAVPEDRVPLLRDLVCRIGLEAAMNREAAKQLVVEAKKIARRVDSWISLTNALDDPQWGLISRYFPSSDERREFLASPEYEELDRLLLRVIERKGLFPRSDNGHNGASG